MGARRILAYGAMVAAAWAVPTSAALAGKPGGGGGGGGGGGAVDTGVVHFQTSGAALARAWTMDPDGSAKSISPEEILGGKFGAVPSRGLHAGRRWFLQLRVIEGETYPGATIQRRELFAVRDDGVVVAQLTTQADLMALQTAVWAPGDATVSWVARRWSGAVAGPAQIHAAAVVFDGAGNVAGLASQPSAPLVAATIDAEIHDWSPDGTRVVYASGGIWIANVGSGVTARIANSGRDPAWSPDGARIAYQSGGDLRTSSVNGTGAATLAGTGSDIGVYGAPAWSPNGTHIVCMRQAREALSPLRRDVWRFAASGGAGTNLTADLDTRSEPDGGIGLASPTGWR